MKKYDDLIKVISYGLISALAGVIGGFLISIFIWGLVDLLELIDGKSNSYPPRLSDIGMMAMIFGALIGGVAGASSAIRKNK